MQLPSGHSLLAGVPDGVLGALRDALALGVAAALVLQGGGGAARGGSAARNAASAARNATSAARNSARTSRHRTWRCGVRNGRRWG